MLKYRGEPSTPFGRDLRNVLNRIPAALLVDRDTLGNVVPFIHLVTANAVVRYGLDGANEWSGEAVRHASL